jgi:hypothetical protein
MIPRILLSLAVFAALAIPQEPERTLTNADVAAMVKSGLQESTIARAIELSARRGIASFDISPQALIDLKNQGATPLVLNSMLAAEALPKRIMPSAAIPGLPGEPGVYYCEGDRWVELASDIVFPEIDTRWKGMTIIEDRRYVLAGGRAGLQVRQASPSFYVRGISPRRVWQLVRLEPKDDYREWRTAPADVFRYAQSVKQKEPGAPQLEFRAVAHDLFELRPAAALPPGQYAITMLAPGQRWLVTAYEFAVPGD